MSDQQALQDREKQIATLRELRKRRHEERAGRPPRLLRELDAPAVISKEEIKGLLKAEYQNLVVSLYLQLGPDKVAPTQKALARSFHSLQTRELERRKDLIEAIPKAQKRKLKNFSRNIMFRTIPRRLSFSSLQGNSTVSFNSRFTRRTG
jgi:hypothetical protein